ncbi:hypothetical protein MKX01_004651 [Papaver californicum]|nr:hypothetical protein MKX01_004651 [Papaver californicum]
MEAIQEELQQVSNPNEALLQEAKEQESLLRYILQICGTVVESLPMTYLLCRNLIVKSATLLNAISSRRVSLQDEIAIGFHVSVSERFIPGSTSKVSIVELIREGLVVLRKV